MSSDDVVEARYVAEERTLRMVSRGSYLLFAVVALCSLASVVYTLRVLGNRDDYDMAAIMGSTEQGYGGLLRAPFVVPRLLLLLVLLGALAYWDTFRAVCIALVRMRRAERYVFDKLVEQHGDGDNRAYTRLDAFLEEHERKRGTKKQQ